MVNLDFNNIRPMNGSANDGFEEFVCQLARREEIPCTKEFVRKGKPDGGVECYKILEDGSEVAWQAKFFCKAFGDSQYQQIDGSVKEVYGVETRRLNEQVKRNIEQFPEDFMFQLTKGELEILRSHLVTIDSLISHNVTSNSSDNQEVKNWKSQNATSKSAKMGLRKAPYAFTENGVAMLSSEW